MRTITAKYAGQCAGCGYTINRGDSIGYAPAAGRGLGACYCTACLGQYRRDLAADDMDMMTGGY